VLAGLVGWEIVFSSLLEVVGEREGLARFREALGAASETGDGLVQALGDWTEGVGARGFMPLRLHFAVERYRRWAALSADATPQARALTLQELYDTYGLERLAAAYPAIRVRFFRETVFRTAPEPLLAGLDEIVGRIRNDELDADDLLPAVDELRALVPDPEADYFLARLSYPYLRPEDAADFVRSDLGGRRQSEIVVALEDDDGNPFRVRHALNPKEVERLHHLFLAAKLDVRFRMEHRYLVAVNERSQIIGGIYYEIDEEDSAAHLEKIVVADAYRRRGVADGLMREFFNRLRAAGVTAVTTGFFRPEYFYRFGFRIEKRYAGLVKSLGPEEPAPGAA
jgi:ribosomal protein S18 acetylase RimI-like enzyme